MSKAVQFTPIQFNISTHFKRKKTLLYPYLPTPPLGQDTTQGQF